MQEEEEMAATAISIVVDSKANQLQVAVSALVPRKRTGVEDAVTSKLVHYLFWDDKRYCTHLDALLTRLAPLSIVHLASTERAEVRPQLHSRFSRGTVFSLYLFVYL